MRILSAFFVAMLFSMSVAAAPIMDFKTSYDGSSVAASNVTGWNLGDLQLTLSDSLMSTEFSLSEGESYTFDFFDIKLPYLGVGSATVDATLDFLIPTGGSGTGQGSGWWKSAFFVSAGGLEWNSQPGLIELADGSSFFLTFENLSGIQLGHKTTVSATVTANTISVPEPGTLALLGIGMLALGFRRRA